MCSWGFTATTTTQPTPCAAAGQPNTPSIRKETKMIDPKDITINGKQLSEILEKHILWILDKRCGERANLESANLYSANLESANLERANLESANLYSANLSSANLYSANLSSANLESANLESANLERANLYSANLSSAKNIEMADAITRILPEGEIIGWKKCREGIVKLLIPAKAKRSNATGRKCRAEYAKDVAHFTFEGELTKKILTSKHNSNFTYEVGKTIRPDAWDENRWQECSSGIHFFITEWEARNYD
jgi:hypothetical protein